MLRITLDVTQKLVSESLRCFSYFLCTRSCWICHQRTIFPSSLTSKLLKNCLISKLHHFQISFQYNFKTKQSILDCIRFSLLKLVSTFSYLSPMFSFKPLEHDEVSSLSSSFLIYKLVPKAAFSFKCRRGRRSALGTRLIHTLDCKIVGFFFFSKSVKKSVTRGLCVLRVRSSRASHVR